MCAMAHLTLVLLTALTCTVYPSSGRQQQSELPRKWSSVVSSRPTQATIMDPCEKERNMKMICHCEREPLNENNQQSTAPNQTFRSAECWILKNDLTLQDPLWKAFDRYSGMSDLKFIVQSGSLDFLPTMIFKNMIHLVDIAVMYSNINTVEGFAFANLSAVHTIRLNNNNHLKSLQRNAFANHDRLRRLDVEKNDIQQIDRHAFVNLFSLEYLALNHNNISEIRNGTFSGLQSLLELQLQHNRIVEVTSVMFHRLESLRVLKLSSNKIQFVGNAAFTELWSLQELYLDNNHIEKITERAFDGLNNLRKMSLQRNRLTVLDDALFTSVPVLDWLILSENRLKTLQEVTFASILNNFIKNDSRLLLSGNHLVCDCTLNWLNELRNDTKSEETLQSIENLQCLWRDSDVISKDFLFNAIGSSDTYHHRDDGALDDMEMDGPIDLQSGIKVHVHLLEQLTCHEVPTSVPMPRESTGFRDNASSIKTSLLIWIILFFVVII